MSRVLITGATGFIGAAVAKRFAADGWEVHGLMRGVHPETVLGALRFDLVVHCAGLFIAEHQHEDLPALIESNILCGTQVVDAMVRHNCHWLVNLSTSWEHYHNEQYNPVNLYAATKAAFRDILEYYFRRYGLAIATVSLFDSYGPDDRRRKLIPALLDAERTGAELRLSPGEQLLHLVHVDDIAAAISQASIAMRSEPHHPIEWAVPSRERMSLREIIDLFQAVRGCRLNARFGVRDYRIREMMIPWSGGIRVPGWEPLIPLRVGLAALPRVAAAAPGSPATA